MRTHKIFCTSLLCLLFTTVTGVSFAGDFGWMTALNNTAQEDPTGYRTRLADRFNVGQTAVDDVLHATKNPADAYMLLRLGEMSSTPTDQVIQKYNTEKGQGWGALAKSLGIKPGSPEFHELKNGGDLYGNKSSRQNDDKGKGKDKDKGKNKEKPKGKN